MSISSRIAELNAQGRAVPRDIPPELATMPSGVFLHDIATAQRLDREREAEEAQRRQEALERVQAADEAAYTSSIYVRTEPYRDGPVPTAAALAVDVEGLSAARSELVRCSAWLDQTQKIQE